jgi:hypothetical protein
MSVDVNVGRVLEERKRKKERKLNFVFIGNQPPLIILYFITHAIYLNINGRH